MVPVIEGDVICVTAGVVRHDGAFEDTMALKEVANFGFQEIQSLFTICIVLIVSIHCGPKGWQTVDDPHAVFSVCSLRPVSIHM